MKLYVNFAIFSDPSTPWGQATGEIEVPSEPGRLLLKLAAPALPQELLVAPLAPLAVRYGVPSQASADILAVDAAAAREICRWFEREWRLFPEPWNDAEFAAFHPDE